MTGKTIFFLLIMGLILRIVFLLLIPPFSGNDEPAHLAYAQHILNEKKLPNATLYPNENLAGNEYFQPPAYYFLSSIFISTAEKTTGQLRILRTLSIFLWTVGFYFAYKILKILKLPTWLSLSTLAFLAFLPSYIVNSSTVTNDSLSVPFTIITIYYLIMFSSTKITYPNILILSVLSAITVLTKLNGFILIPTVLATLYYSKDKNIQAFFFKCLLYVGLTAIICSWWFIYNKQIYGDLMGPISASTATFAKIPFGLQKIYLVTRGTFATFWVAYGPANEIRLPAFVYGFLFLLSSLALAGNIIYTKRILKGRIIKILLVAFISNLILHFAFNVNEHQPLGRYLFLSLIQIALIFSFGIGNLLPFKTRNHLPYFLTGLFFVLNIWGILILINYYKLG